MCISYADIWICNIKCGNMDMQYMYIILLWLALWIWIWGQVQEMARITVTEIYAKEGGRGQKFGVGGCLHRIIKRKTKMTFLTNSVGGSSDGT